MQLDPLLLRSFIAVKEAGGFTRAAQRLHLTQSAISHQIRRLEEQLGRSLFCRSTRSLTLTEDGADLLPYAEQILQAQDALKRRFQPSPVSGLVRFGVPENYMGNRLPSLLCQFARAFPAVRLDVSVSMNLDLRAMIDTDALDLAVVLGVCGQDHGTVLRHTQLVWVAAENFEPAPGASLPLAFFPTPCIYRQAGVEALGSTSLEWHVIFTSPSQQGLHAAVQAGLGVSILARDDVEPGMKIVDGRYGLPPLPEVAFTLIGGGDAPATREFARLVLDLP